MHGTQARLSLIGELCSDLYHTHILENFLKILVKVSFFVVLNRFWHEWWKNGPPSLLSFFGNARSF